MTTTAPYRGPVAIPPAGACPDRVRLLAFAADVPEAAMRRALAHYHPSEQALAVRLTAREMVPPRAGSERHAVPLAARRALAEAGFHFIEQETAA